MNKTDKIGSYGAFCLILTLIITKALISAPAFYVKQSQSAGWLNVLLCGVFNCIILAIVLKFLDNFENMDLIDIAQYSFGSIGKYIVGIVSCLVFLVVSAAVFRCFLEMVRNTVIRGSSYESIAIFVFVCGITGAYFGIRTQINLIGLALPFLLGSVLLILFINYSRITITNIQPILGDGVTNITTNAILKNSSFFEIGTILFLVPCFKDKNAVKKISFTTLAAGTLVLTTITLCYQLSIPYEAAETFELPLYQMTRMLKAGTFFQRIEPLNVFIWSCASFIYVSFGIVAATMIFRKTFNISVSRPLVFVAGEIVCLLSLIPGSETRVEEIYDFLLTYTNIVFPGLGLAFLICASAFKRRNGV